MQATMFSLLNNPMTNAAAQGMMRGGHGGFGGFFLGGLMSVLWTVLIVLLVLWVTRNWSSISSSVRRAASSLQTSSAPAGTQKPLEILQTRYAKGEITREEYETIRRDLTGEPAPASEPASAPAAETPTTQA